MIKINNNQLQIIGTVKEVSEEITELKEIYGNIKVADLMCKLQEKWG